MESMFTFCEGFSDCNGLPGFLFNLLLLLSELCLTVLMLCLLCTEVTVEAVERL